MTRRGIEFEFKVEYSSTLDKILTFIINFTTYLPEIYILVSTYFNRVKIFNKTIKLFVFLL